MATKQEGEGNVTDLATRALLEACREYTTRTIRGRNVEGVLATLESIGREALEQHEEGMTPEAINAMGAIVKTTEAERDEAVRLLELSLPGYMPKSAVAQEIEDFLASRGKP